MQCLLMRSQSAIILLAPLALSSAWVVLEFTFREPFPVPRVVDVVLFGVIAPLLCFVWLQVIGLIAWCANRKRITKARAAILSGFGLFSVCCTIPCTVSYVREVCENAQMMRVLP